MTEEQEMQLLGAQAQMIAEQMDKIDSSVMEIEYLKNSLDEFKNTKKGTELFIPVSNGMFAKAKLEENNKLMVNVGNGVVVEKTVEEAKSLLDEKSRELSEMKETLVEQLKHIEEHLKQEE